MQCAHAKPSRFAPLRRVNDCLTKGVATMALGGRRLSMSALLLAGLAVVALLIWQGVTAEGAPDPTVPHLGRAPSCSTARCWSSARGSRRSWSSPRSPRAWSGARRLRRPVAAGAGLGLAATLVTWFVAVGHRSARWTLPALHSGGDRPARYGRPAGGDELVLPQGLLDRLDRDAQPARRRLLHGTATTRARSSGRASRCSASPRCTARASRSSSSCRDLRLQAGSGPVLEGVAVGLAPHRGRRRAHLRGPPPPAVQADAGADRRACSASSCW